MTTPGQPGSRRLFATIPYVGIIAAVSLFYLTGWLQFVDREFLDQRYSLTKQRASGELILVAIDPPSLRAIGTWPWPRGLHGDAIEKVLAAGVDQLALDLDLSSASTESEDKRLEDVLAGTNARVILPVFKQFQSLTETTVQLIGTVPLNRFSQHTHLASINVQPDEDGLIRRQSVWDQWNRFRLRSLPAHLAKMETDGAASFLIDFGIDPRSIPIISFSELLAGNYDPQQLAGKNVIIGATAVELGDQLAVPLYRSLPSPMIAALAYESLVQGRAIQEINSWIVLLLMAAVVILIGTRMSDWTWRRGLTITMGTIFATWVISLAIQMFLPISLDTSPIMLAVGLSFGMGLASNVDRAALFASISLREADHHRAVLKNLADSTFDGIIIIYGDLTIDFFNPAAERMFGRSQFEVLAQPISHIIKQADSFFETTATGIKPRSAGLQDAIGLRADRTEFPIEVVITEILDRSNSGTEPTISSFLITIRDITERVAAAEEARRHHQQMLRVNRMQSMGSLASGLAHELGQPLTAIHFLLYRARQNTEDLAELPDQVSDDVGRAMQQADRATDIIKQLRRFVGQGEPERELIDTRKLIEEVAESLSLDATAEVITIRTELPNAAPKAMIDEVQIMQVLVNLGRNALDAMKEKPPKNPSLVLRLMVNGETDICIEAEDNGPGIPEEVMEHIFEPFFTTKDEGLGYGLALCKMIVEDHGGTLTVKSEPGKTVFQMNLPLGTDTVA